MTNFTVQTGCKNQFFIGVSFGYIPCIAAGVFIGTIISCIFSFYRQRRLLHLTNKIDAHAIAAFNIIIA